MYPVPNWPLEPPRWTKDGQREPLLKPSNKDNVHDSNLDEVLKRSEEFPVKFPIDAGRCKTLINKVQKTVLEKNINSAYPLLHENVLPLYADFILHKRKFGSALERELYKNMNVLQLVDRLLKQRAVMFMGRLDDYILLNGPKGRGKWETIGKESESEPLVLTDCLSYDEIKLSVFLSVSSYTYFVNDGNRRNKGAPATNRNNVEDEGIIIGLIGARMKKKGAMEYQEMVISKEQNVKTNGYGTLFVPTIPSLFCGFYGKPTETYKEFLKNKDFNKPGYYKEISKGIYFDNITYAKRMALSIDTLLIEANQRAKEKNTTAFVHVVGIGLGVWKCSVHQEEVFMETFAKRVELLGKYLHSVSDIYFAYFRQSPTCGKYKHGSTIPIDGHPKSGIKVFIAERQPHEKLTGDNKGKLAVVSYAWDGNALPGNEFWSGKLASTGDSAAASSTQIAELHNPHINPRVTAQNLRIATREGVVPFAMYMQNALSSSNKRKHNEGEGSTSQE